MKKRQSISVERMIELEQWLYNNYSKYLSMDSFEGFILTDLDYLKKAYCMPYSTVIEYLNIYDDTSPKMDEIKFVNNLQKEFGTTNANDIIERVRNVRKIKRHCLDYGIAINTITVKTYNKLVRDNIPDICRANGEEPHTRVLNDQEYWQYLLKKDQEELEEVKTAPNLEERKKELADKLELLRAMSEFSGFTLDGIIIEADKKKQKNGGFEKRLLLEKVIKK